jgi:hypothetical protein
MKLTHSYRIRLSEFDMQLINELKKYRKKPTTFIRDAFREKIQREFPQIKLQHKKEYCPF